MAYVGSPSDLVKQPGTSTSSKPAGLWKPLLAMIVAAAIVVMAVMAIGSLVGSKQVAPVGLSHAQVASLQWSLPPAGLSRAQIASLQQSAVPAGLSRAQIASLQQSVLPAGLSRAQIASLQQSGGLTGLNSTQIASDQQDVSRMVFQTAPHHRLTRTPR